MKSVSKDFKFSVTTKGAAMMLGVTPKTLEETLELMVLIDKCRKNGNLLQIKDLCREYQARLHASMSALYSQDKDKI